MKCEICKSQIMVKFLDTVHDGIASSSSCACSPAKPTFPAYRDDILVSPQAMQDILTWGGSEPPKRSAFGKMVQELCNRVNGAKKQIEKGEAKQARWDRDFLELAAYWANKKSKDPSTKVGAVIVDEDNAIVSLSYNGFAQDVEDTQERLQDRDVKLFLTAHAELNAVAFANRPNLRGCTIYVSKLAPCSPCSTLLIQKKIRRVVYEKPKKALEGRWAESNKWAMVQFAEAGVMVDCIDLEETKP